MSAGTLYKEISFKRGEKQKRKVFVIFTYILWQLCAENIFFIIIIELFELEGTLKII